MSAKPLLFAGPHACWQQRLSRERHATYNFHDSDQFQEHDQVYPEYLQKIDKKMVRSWRQAHPKRYHPPSIASHATARTSRSMVPTHASHAIRNAGQNLAVANQSPPNARSGSLINQPVHQMAQTFTQGFQPVHRMAQKRHGGKTIEDLLAENEAYDHAIQTLNERRGLMGYNMGRENKKGREAIAKYMGASSGPFAVIAEPTNPEAASPFQIQPQAYTSKPRRQHIPLPFEKFYSRPQQADAASSVSNKTAVFESNVKIPKRHRSTKVNDKDSCVDTNRALSEFSLRSNVRKAIGDQVGMDLNDQGALSSTAKHLLKQLSAQLEKEKVEGTRLKERLRELKRNSHDKGHQEFTHVY